MLAFWGCFFVLFVAYNNDKKNYKQKNNIYLIKHFFRNMIPNSQHAQKTTSDLFTELHVMSLIVA